MLGQNVGYRRVSSVDQSPERQLSDIELDETFTDFTSGKERNRPQLEACLKYCGKNDVLHVLLQGIPITALCL